MTLVLTEVSDAGIAMVADSAISVIRNGKVISSDKQWDKLLWVPRIKAGVSYWGFIGRVAEGRFDEWLKHRITSGAYADLRSFADYLAAELNAACNQKPLLADEAVGIHVAGYAPWPDGVSRPTFFHVHNGHLKRVRWGKAAQDNNGFGIGPVKIVGDPTYEWEPRGLFARHDDFPNPGRGVDQNRLALRGGYITRNGDFATYIPISNAIRLAAESLSLTPGVRVPGDPSRLGPRLGYRKMEMETVIHLYKCSSMRRIVGGKISTLGIKPDGKRLT